MCQINLIYNLVYIYIYIICITAYFSYYAILLHILYTRAKICTDFAYLCIFPHLLNRFVQALLEGRWEFLHAGRCYPKMSSTTMRLAWLSNILAKPSNGIDLILSGRPSFKKNKVNEKYRSKTYSNSRGQDQAAESGCEVSFKIHWSTWADSILHTHTHFTHSHPGTNTRARARTHARAHTHTVTHTHTQPCSFLC